MGMPGTATGGGDPAVLEDPTGRRARWMGWAGRAVFVLFLGWLLAIVLGGLGLMPIAGIPLAHVLKAPRRGPPPLVELPKPRTPSASDLRPALPASVFAAKTAGAARPAQSHGRSATAQKNTSTTPRRAGVHGRSAAAPGHPGRPRRARRAREERNPTQKDHHDTETGSGTREERGRAGADENDSRRHRRAREHRNQTRKGDDDRGFDRGSCGRARWRPTNANDDNVCVPKPKKT